MADGQVDARCPDCDHSAHEGFCYHALTETVRDDVGIFSRPTHKITTLLVGRCRCGRAPFNRDHRLDVVYHLPSSGYYSRCTCGWRSDWEMHLYAAERSLVTHIQAKTPVAHG
jgi:hypothetical protein